MWAFINDKLIPAEEATIPVGDLAIQRGYAVFDFFRTAETVPLFIDDHLERLARSAKALRLPVKYSADEWKTIIRELLQKNGLSSSGIRITVTGGTSPDTYTPTEPNIIITQQQLVMKGEEGFQNGLHLITHEYVRDLPAIKTINYLMGVWLQQKVKVAGADDILYVKNGYISELPRSNIFVVSYDGTLSTPSANILEGITRKQVLRLSKSLLPAMECDISMNDLIKSSEVFVTSTTKRLLPVLSINGQKIGEGKPGPVTKALYNSFLELEQKEIARGW